MNSLCDLRMKGILDHALGAQVTVTLIGTEQGMIDGVRTNVEVCEVFRLMGYV